MVRLDHPSHASRPAILALAFSLVGVIGVADYVTGPEISLGLLYLGPISFVSWFVSASPAVVLSVLSGIVWLICDAMTRDYSHPLMPYWNAFVRFGFFFLFAITLSGLRRALAAQFEREVEIARNIQMRLLPSERPTLEGIDIGVRLIPLQRLSGDYYDFFHWRESLGIVVADASGKGLPASLLMANLHALFHSAHLLLQDPKDIPAMVRALNEHLVTHTDYDQFVTFFYVCFSPDEQLFRYVGAGHRPCHSERSEESRFRGVPALRVRFFTALCFVQNDRKGVG